MIHLVHGCGHLERLACESYAKSRWFSNAKNLRLNDMQVAVRKGGFSGNQTRTGSIDVDNLLDGW